MSVHDRNFDDLAQRFSERVYGSIKGQIRLQVLWRDLSHTLGDLAVAKPMRILDVGGGLGQISIGLAKLGHSVVYNDVSTEMAAKARAAAAELGVAESITWLVAPYQEIVHNVTEKFDLILCHAVIEWLAQPAALIPVLKSLLKVDGCLSLCFYNPDALIFRNLMRGNFYHTNGLSNVPIEYAEASKKSKHSLTPTNPSAVADVKKWLIQNQLELTLVSGMRVFSDYTRESRGGLVNAEAIVAEEVKYSNREPFKWLGRYLHFVARYYVLGDTCL